MIRTFKPAEELPKASPVEAVPEITVAVVQDLRGQTVRTYDLATHGKNFEALAHMFVSHHADTKVVVH